jgi:hypothetical protein
MMLVSSALPVVSRRRMLLGAATVALLGVPAAACGRTQPSPEVDEITAQLERAQADSRMAADAATAAPRDVARALNTVAAERTAHAQALTDQLVRLAGRNAPASNTAAPTSTTASAPAKAPTPKDVVAALEQSADSATQLAAKLSGYSAGLVGSIAAACTAAYTVALASPGQAS